MYLHGRIEDPYPRIVHIHDSKHYILVLQRHCLEKKRIKIPYYLSAHVKLLTGSIFWQKQEMNKKFVKES